MDSTSLRQKTKEELIQLVKGLQKELVDFKIKFSKGLEKSNQKIRKLKKDIARLKTVLNEKLFLEGMGL